MENVVLIKDLNDPLSSFGQSYLNENRNVEKFNTIGLARLIYFWNAYEIQA